MSVNLNRRSLLAVIGLFGVAPIATARAAAAPRRGLALQWPEPVHGDLPYEFGSWPVYDPKWSVVICHDYAHPDVGAKWRARVRAGLLAHDREAAA